MSDISLEDLVRLVSPAFVGEERARYRCAVGDEIDGFRVTGLLGVGAAGEVYEVWNQELGCECALKLMTRGAVAGAVADEKDFAREVEVLSGMRHPNIVRALRTGKWRGADYLVMEKLSGLPENPDSEQVRDWLLKLCAAVSELNRKGWIHRDIKPENVLWDAEHEEPVLVDFGIAQASGAAGVGGTRATGAPEQFVRSGAGVSAASDVYGLGIESV